ncbi:MAG: hypothetical protein WAL26_04870 [Mycobacterium sp.]
MSVALMPLSRKLRAFIAAASSTLRGRPLVPVSCGGSQSGTGALDRGVAFQLNESLGPAGLMLLGGAGSGRMGALEALVSELLTSNTDG